MPKPSRDPFRDWLRLRQNARYGIDRLAAQIPVTRAQVYRWLDGSGVSLALAPKVIAAGKKDGVALTIEHLGPKASE